MEWDFLQDKKITWKAKGLLTMLIMSYGKPVRLEELHDFTKESWPNFKAGIDELIGAGYLGKIFYEVTEEDRMKMFKYKGEEYLLLTI